LAIGSLVVITLFAVKLFLFRARVSGKVDVLMVYDVLASVAFHGVIACLAVETALAVVL
jgi:hypothetical protein